MNASPNLIPETITLPGLAPLPLWVAWQTQEREPGKPPTKVPYGSVNRKAQAGKPETWTTRATAEVVAEQLPKPFGAGGIGIEFSDLGDGRSLGGIDLDTCRDPATGEIAGWAQDIIATLGTYTEVSPSQTGVKAFLAYWTDDKPDLLAAMGTSGGKKFSRGTGEHPPAVEIYLAARYFAVTGEAIEDSPTELRTFEIEELIRLIKEIGPAFAAEGTEQAEPATFETLKKKQRRAPSDRSRSGLAFRKGKELRRGGATYEQMIEGLLADPETEAWTREKGLTADQRELRRIWEKAEARGPLIRIIAGQLHITVTQAEAALLQSDLPIFQRGDALVQPISREVPASHGRTTIAAALGEMSKHALVDKMSQVAEWEKFDKRAEDFVPTDPPVQIAEVLLSRTGQWQFPSIAGIITTPTLRPDGSLLTAPGYDEATRLYHVADPTLRLHPAVHNPTRQAAEAALRALEGLLSEFPFVVVKREGQPDLHVAKAVALSGLITPVVRGAMPVAPLHVFNAHAPGSGKSYLVDVASMIATARPCPVITAAPEEAETEKRIGGLLLAGYPVVSIDNCNGELGGDLLCQAVERPLIRIRRLGGSDIIEVESCSSMFATGNNVRVRGDMVRRSLLSGLYPEMERPELREFEKNPVETIQADRGRYVSACLVIVRAYIVAGCPGKLSPIASFEAWSNLVRSALVWLGCADPCLSMEAAREDDPELSELREVMEAWDEAFGASSTTCADAITTAASKAVETDADGSPVQFGRNTGELRFPAMHEAFRRVALLRGNIEASQLGYWLRAKDGRIVTIGKDERRFRKAGISAGKVRWCLDKVKR